MNKQGITNPLCISTLINFALKPVGLNFVFSGYFSLENFAFNKHLGEKNVNINRSIREYTVFVPYDQNFQKHWVFGWQTKMSKSFWMRSRVDCPA